MGKITVHGYSEIEVDYDLVELTIKFQAREKTASRAAEEVMKQCDAFLKALESKGVKLDEIHMKEDSIGRTYRDRENDSVTADREIEFTMPFNMKFLNSIMTLIRNFSGDIEYHTDFKLKDTEKIQEELLQKAVLDAKKKAESIAAALGQRVLDLKSVMNGSSGEMEKCLNYEGLFDDEDEYFDEEYLSDALKVPISNERAVVETVWIIG